MSGHSYVFLWGFKACWMLLVMSLAWPWVFNTRIGKLELIWIGQLQLIDQSKCQATTVEGVPKISRLD